LKPGHFLGRLWKRGSRSLQLDRYSAIALVDTQPGAPDNYLFSGDAPHIVFDHHEPIDHGQAEVKYVDILSSIGTTTTLVFQHLMAADVDLIASLSTALFFAIKVTTCGLSRGASSTDVAAYLDLLPRIEPKILSRVECAKLPGEDFPAFVRGLTMARIYSRIVIANMCIIHRPGFVVEMADLLINLERAHGVLCTGSCRGELHIAIRITRRKKNTSSLLQKTVNGMGQVEGDGKFAKGQIPLDDDIAQNAFVEGQVTKQFLCLLGQEGASFS